MIEHNEKPGASSHHCPWFRELQDWRGRMDMCLEEKISFNVRSIRNDEHSRFLCPKSQHFSRFGEKGLLDDTTGIRYLNPIKGNNP